jgi:hypothetical protein
LIGIGGDEGGGERIVSDDDDIGVVSLCGLYGVWDHDINGTLDIFGSCQQLEDILGKCLMALDICEVIGRNMVCIV